MFIKNIKIKDIKLEIGQLVKSFRNRDKISQEELAEKLNLSRITIQNLEAGKNFTIDTLLKVLQHFDLLNSLNEILKDKRNDHENTESLYSATAKNEIINVFCFGSEILQFSLNIFLPLRDYLRVGMQF